MHSSRNQSGSVFVIVIILTIAIISALGFVLWENFVNTDAAKSEPQTYEECIAAEGSKILETYPEQCMTAGGRSFSNPDQVLRMYKAFSTSKHGITFTYPNTWTANQLTSDDQVDAYTSSSELKNETGETVALLGTGGQIGGLCDSSAPDVEVTVLDTEDISIPSTNVKTYSYSIVRDEDSRYYIAYGLSAKNMQDSTYTTKCPGMSVNYQYIFNADEQSLGGLTFGYWFNQTSKSFNTIEEAKDYVTTSEYKEIKKSITSLQIR